MLCINILWLLWICSWTSQGQGQVVTGTSPSCGGCFGIAVVTSVRYNGDVVDPTTELTSELQTDPGYLAESIGRITFNGQMEIVGQTVYPNTLTNNSFYEPTTILPDSASISIQSYEIDTVILAGTSCATSPVLSFENAQGSIRYPCPTSAVLSEYQSLVSSAAMQFVLGIDTSLFSNACGLYPSKSSDDSGNIFSSENAVLTTPKIIMLIIIGSVGTFVIALGIFFIWRYRAKWNRIRSRFNRPQPDSAYADEQGRTEIDGQQVAQVEDVQPTEADSLPRNEATSNMLAVEKDGQMRNELAGHVPMAELPERAYTAKDFTA